MSSGSPFQFTSGPRDAHVVLVGEAWGEQESIVKRPFIGAAGQELSRLLAQVGIPRQQCLLTNVFQFRPESNNIYSLCAKRTELPKDYSWPPLATGKYIRPEFLDEVERLREELQSFPRNLVVALGATASWALLGNPAIGTIRGTISESRLCPGLKVLPTFHPANVLYNWSQRPILVADLMKAKRESEFPEIRRPHREVLVDPTLAEIRQWIDEAQSARFLAVDIETGNRQIKCIGFASSPQHALVVPFVDFRRPGGSYWPTHAQELSAWECVRQLLNSSATKIFQNGLYDLQYLWRMGFRPRNCTADTMLMSHALYPEMPKGLGFLGSIHTNESAWKIMRKQSEVVKRDE